jgi:hypothetical protein
MKRDLVKRPERLEAAQHDSTGPYFVSIQVDEGWIGITPARAVRGLIPVVIMPAAAESSVPQAPPITWPHLCEPDSALQDDFAEGQAC